MIKVKVFAVLKDYFAETIELESAASVSEVIQILIKQNPDSRNIISKCRFAINEEFVGVETKVNFNDCIFVMPPFNGG